MITIQNEKLTAHINELGAELKSLQFQGTEYIWPGDPNIWAGSAPIIFPICSGLRDGEYYLDGKKYSMPKSGYARFLTFQVESLQEDAVTFLVCSDEESRTQYPFDYELRITYKVIGNQLKIGYEVKNLSADTMYFSIGGHEGYYCPEGVEEYDIIFPEAETLDSTVLVGDTLGYEKVRILENSDTLALKYEDFRADALVFENIRARTAVLKNRNTGRALKLTFDDFDYFLLWTKQDAPFICMEPWCGLADRVDTDKNFKTKEGVLTIPVGGTCVKTHTMEILA